MAYLNIRDENTGKVILRETDLISRHLMTITLAKQDFTQRQFAVDGITEGIPYVVYDCNQNYVGLNANTSIVVRIPFCRFEWSISGNVITVKQTPLSPSSENSSFISARRQPTYVHVGVY